MSKIEVDQIDPSSGTNLTVGSSGDTVTVTGNVVKTNAVQGSDGGNIISQSGTTNTIGATGDVIKTAAGTTKLEVQGDGSSVEGKIQLNCHANSHGVILQSPPHSSGQSWTIKLPDNQIAADKFIKIKSITGSGATAVGQAEFADAGGGQWTHLLTSSASNSSSMAFSSTYITTTYLDYMFVFSGIKFASDGVYPRFEFSTDNGSNYSANGTMKNARSGVNAAGNDVNSGQTGSSGLFFASSQGVGNSTGEGMAGFVIVFDPLKQSGTTDMHTRMLSNITADDTGGDPVTATTANKVNFADAVNNIKFTTNSGNITSGKVSLYGRKIS